MADKLTFDNISSRQRNLIMTGLAIALFAACFDGTVTTTCGPTIASQFNASDLLPWLTTGYLLMETVTIPLSGKLSDLYGRKKLLIIGLTLFGLASLAAGVAPNMWVVIIARAIQGAGGGILIPVATAAVSDLYAPEERGKIQGALGALFGIGMGAGPLIGGFFAGLGDLGFIHGWHLAFLINLPVVLLVLYMCKHEFPVMANEGKTPSIDFKGSALISLALILVVMYFQFLGKAFDVVSIPSLVIIAIIIAVLKAFAYVEHRAAEPIMALHIFENPTVRSAAIMLFVLGFAIVGDELFMGMYLQKIIGFSPVDAGLYILIMVFGMIIASSVGGALLNKTGTKPWVIAGPVLMCVAYYMFSYITPEFDQPVFCLSEFLFGLGSGCLLASLMTAVQNSCDHSEVGMTTSAVNLMRNIGSTIGTSVLTLIVNAAIFSEATSRGLGGIAESGTGILDYLGTLGPATDAVIKTVFTDGVGTAFGFVSLALIIASIIGIRFKIVKMSQTAEIVQFTENLTKDNPKQ
ncbi:MAG: MFS transporter [archaeon]|nr:MFS transporter [archaeon]